MLPVDEPSEAVVTEVPLRWSVPEHRPLCIDTSLSPGQRLMIPFEFVPFAYRRELEPSIGRSIRLRPGPGDDLLYLIVTDPGDGYTIVKV